LVKCDLLRKYHVPERIDTTSLTGRVMAVQRLKPVEATLPLPCRLGVVPDNFLDPAGLAILTSSNSNASRDPDLDPTAGGSSPIAKICSTVLYLNEH
jgi:hypothetical protein